MPTKIDQINKSINDFCKREARLFTSKTNSKNISAIQALEQKLNLNNLMSISELHAAILYIENIVLYRKKSPKDEYLSIARSLKQTLENYLQQIEKTLLPRPKFTQEISEVNQIELGSNLKDVADILLQAHVILCQALIKTYLTANGLDRKYSLSYTKNMLYSSPYLQKVIDTTKNTSNAKSNICVDTQRAAVDINGTSGVELQEKFTQLVNSPEDKKNQSEEDINAKVSQDYQAIIREAIENFTNDKVDTVGSQANRIFYFGGQHLYAFLLFEFNSNSRIMFDGKPVAISADVLNKGHISWQEQAGEKIASVKMKVFGCLDSERNSYVMAADGRSIIKLKSDDDDEKLDIIKDRVNKRETNGVSEYYMPKAENVLSSSTSYASNSKSSKKHTNVFKNSNEANDIEMEVFGIEETSDSDVSKATEQPLPQKVYDTAPLAEITAKIKSRQDEKTGQYYFEISAYSVAYSSVAIRPVSGNNNNQVALYDNKNGNNFFPGQPSTFSAKPVESNELQRPFR